MHAMTSRLAARSSNGFAFIFYAIAFGAGFAAAQPMLAILR
jgi:hypothetical protein